MDRKTLLLGLAGVVLLGLGAVASLEIRRRQLRAEAEAWRAQNAGLAKVRAEHHRLQAAHEEEIQRAAGARNAAEPALLAARQELATLLAAPAPTRATTAPAESDPRARNPELALVPLENFRHVGNASPRAAFQTAVWAAVTVMTTCWRARSCWSPPRAPRPRRCWRRCRLKSA